VRATLFLFTFFCLFESSPAAAHARWKAGSLLSPPRSLNDNLKTPPCGGTERSSAPRKYNAGDSVSLEFEETINHPGYFEIHLLGSDDKPVQGVQVPLLKIEDNQNERVAGNTYHQFKAELKIPQVECTGCTLQLIQVMLDDPKKPSNYYSCSDLTIAASKSGPAKPTGLKIERKR
jgi:hypothetical protein